MWFVCVVVYGGGVCVCVCEVHSGAQTLVLGLTQQHFTISTISPAPFFSFKIPGKYQEQDTL